MVKHTGAQCEISAGYSRQSAMASAPTSPDLAAKARERVSQRLRTPPHPSPPHSLTFLSLTPFLLHHDLDPISHRAIHHPKLLVLPPLLPASRPAPLARPARAGRARARLRRVQERGRAVVGCPEGDVVLVLEGEVGVAEEEEGGEGGG